MDGETNHERVAGTPAEGRAMSINKKRALARSAVGCAVLLVAGITTAGMAAAEDEGHFAWSDVYETEGFALFGLNPCTGEYESGMQFEVVVDEGEVEDGVMKTSTSTSGSVQHGSGFVSDYTEEFKGIFDSAGNGTTWIEFDFEVRHPETGEHFSAKHHVTVTYVGGEFAGFDDIAETSDCGRG